MGSAEVDALNCNQIGNRKTIALLLFVSQLDFDREKQASSVIFS